MTSPGAGLGGVLGTVMLVLGFVSLAVLSVTIAGLLLTLAVALFVAELFAPGIGVFAGGGAIALVVSGLLLFEEPFEVDPMALWPTGRRGATTRRGRSETARRTTAAIASSVARMSSP